MLRPTALAEGDMGSDSPVARAPVRGIVVGPMVGLARRGTGRLRAA